MQGRKLPWQSMLFNSTYCFDNLICINQVKELRHQLMESHNENRRQMAEVNSKAEITEKDLRQMIEERDRKHKSQLEQQRCLLIA